MKRRQLLAAGLVLPCTHAAAQARQGQGQAQDQQAIDWPALQLLDGTTLSPSSWQGQAAIVVFWATYCPFCKRHNAHINKLQQAVRGQPLRILGVALDSDAEAVRRYMASHGYQFPVTVDGEALRRRLTSRRIIPMTCLIDRQGRLVQAIPGEMTEDDVLGLPRSLLRPTAT
jgi:thiol-disulfide isomerase/thioredoxin